MLNSISSLYFTCLVVLPSVMMNVSSPYIGLGGYLIWLMMH